jgi:hypothetical protein
MDGILSLTAVLMISDMRAAPSRMEKKEWR